MYDKDKSKTIQLGEMVELFGRNSSTLNVTFHDISKLCSYLRNYFPGTLYLNEGLEKEAAVERAMAIFSTLDINNDGEGQQQQQQQQHIGICK